MTRLFAALMTVTLSMAAFPNATIAETQAPAPANLPLDLAAALKAYNEATVTNDVETLSRLVADDYILVN